jgi:hypothetical protein
MARISFIYITNGLDISKYRNVGSSALSTVQQPAQYTINCPRHTSFRCTRRAAHPAMQSQCAVARHYSPTRTDSCTLSTTHSQCAVARHHSPTHTDSCTPSTTHSQCAVTRHYSPTHTDSCTAVAVRSQIRPHSNTKPL